MSEFILWMLLISLWGVILFFGKSFGISVILFIIPLLTYLYFILKRNNKIKNRKGLLLMIPIVLLSMSYLIFDNETFGILNIPIIYILFLLLYIFTIKPKFKLTNILSDIIYLMFTPFTYIKRLFLVTNGKLSKLFETSSNTKKIFLSILIVIPIVAIILILLGSADMIFRNIFNNIYSNISKIFNDLFEGILPKIITFIILFILLGTTSMYLIFGYEKKEDKVVVKNKKIDLFTIKLLVTVLNIIYILFDYIQIKSLILHNVTSGINFAEYARSGFFQLMIVSIINITIMLVTKKFEDDNNKKEFKYINIMNIVMVLLTLIIIISSFLRMNLYEVAYGYTVLRLLVYITLITESILMIPTVIYIVNKNKNILKSYMIIIISVYVLINFINIDYIIARRNVNRYYRNNEIDLSYIENYRSDNIPILIELYDKLDDEEMKKNLSGYFEFLLKKEKYSWSEFKISRYFNVNKLNGVNLIDMNNNPYYQFHQYKFNRLLDIKLYRIIDNNAYVKEEKRLIKWFEELNKKQNNVNKDLNDR